MFHISKISTADPDTAELGLQRIEAQHTLLLSRQLGTPNIASKGKLLPRSALVPLVLFPEAHPLREETKGKKLIEEVDPQPLPDAPKPTKDVPALPPKSILKTPVKPLIEEIQEPMRRTLPQKGTMSPQSKERPKFEWSKDGERIKITVHVPKLVSPYKPLSETRSEELV